MIALKVELYEWSIKNLYVFSHFMWSILYSIQISMSLIAISDTFLFQRNFIVNSKVKLLILVQKFRQNFIII